MCLIMPDFYANLSSRESNSGHISWNLGPNPAFSVIFLGIWVQIRSNPPILLGIWVQIRSNPSESGVSDPLEPVLARPNPGFCRFLSVSIGRSAILYYILVCHLDMALPIDFR